MKRIEPVEPADATGRRQAALEAAREQLGALPNLVRTLAHSPATLEAYLAQGRALATGALGARLREQIAVAVAGVNGCDYCASAHTALGRRAGASAAELRENLAGRSTDPRTAAALELATGVVRARGHVSDAELDAVRRAGLSDEEIVEIVAHVGVNLFTNYFNHVARTEVDFPRVHAVVPTP